MKPGRQTVILDIIREEDIETQQQLKDALAARGVKSTQATLSRDIKDIRLVKELGASGKYHYVSAAKMETDNSGFKMKKILKESIVSFDTAQNLMVIKTLPGLGSAVGAAIDGIFIENLVGTIAGDDTAFLAFKSKEDADRLFAEFEQIL